MLFRSDEPTPDAIAGCVRRFITVESTFSRSACRSNAERFAAERFRAEFTTLVAGYVEAAHLRAETPADHNATLESLAA